MCANVQNTCALLHAVNIVMMISVEFREFLLSRHAELSSLCERVPVLSLLANMEHKHSKGMNIFQDMASLRVVLNRTPAGLIEESCFRYLHLGAAPGS